MNKKEIIIFTEYFIPKLGGVERYTDKLVNELKSKYNITIITSKLDEVEEYEEKENVRIFRVPIHKIFKNRYALIKNNKKLKQIIKEMNKTKYDFLLCQTRFFPLSYFGVKYAKKNNIPVMVIEHGSSHFTVNNKVLDFLGHIYEHKLTNAVKKKCDLFYGVSERCVLWLKHFKIDAKGVLYNSIDQNDYDKYKDKYFFKKNKKEINICYAGRLIKEKGLYELCDAFNKLSKDYKNIKLQIAGDGPILEDLKEKYSKNKKIKFLGKLNFDNVMKLYNSCDIFVYPSMYAEGLLTSILEAGLMKCTVVATDRGGTVEVITNKKDGLICEENTESIHDNIKYLLDNPKIMEEYSEKLHKRIIENFTWNVTAEKLSKIIEKESR